MLFSKFEVWSAKLERAASPPATSRPRLVRPSLTAQSEAPSLWSEVGLGTGEWTWASSEFGLVARDGQHTLSPLPYHDASPGAGLCLRGMSPLLAATISP